MIDTANPRVVEGHNNPPPPTPYEAHKANIDDLVMEAQNFLDGEPIETEAQAEAVSKLLDDARKASSAADAQRKVEAKPFDDGKAEVQALWKPLVASADLAVSTCKRALEPFLHAKEEAQRAAADAARLEAERQAAAARKAIENASPSDLAGQMTARVLQENAAELEKQAKRLDKQRAQVRGGERANSLRTSYSAEILDPIAFGKWAWEHRKDEYLAFLTSLALGECRHGPRDLPGVRVIEKKTAV